jgi:hypothetical protein
MKKLEQILILLSVSITANLYLLSPTNCPLSCICDLELSILSINCTEDEQRMFILPTNLMENSLIQIRQIILENCFLITIPINICILKNLTVLDLSHNQIKELKEDKFNCSYFLNEFDNDYSPSYEVSTIESLDLSNNQIFELNANFFKSLANLRTLIISSNSLSFLKFDIFNNLINLELLDLSNNQLIELSDGLFYSLINLQFVSINSNFISKINNSLFLNQKNLQGLDLSNNQISRIPYRLFYSHLSSLVYLNLSYNYLTQMELWPLYLKSIKFIDLKFNYIERFTNNFNWFFEIESYLPPLNSFATIDLQYNRITMFDDNTIQQYGVCSYKNFINFIKNYLKAFLLNNNPILCDCTSSKGLLKDVAVYLKSDKLLFNSKLNKSLCKFPAIYTDQSILNFGNCSKHEEYSYCNETGVEIQSNSNLNVSSMLKFICYSIIN